MSRINNTFDLTGYVGADPEKTFNSNSGKPIISVSLGVNDSYRKKDSQERIERTDWFDLTVFQEGLAGVFDQYVRKGSEIHVRGFMRKQVWDSKERVNGDGTPKKDSRIQFIVTDVRLLRRPKDDSGNTGSPQDLDRANAALAHASSAYEDDTPF